MEQLANQLSRGLLAALVVGALLGLLEARQRVDAWYQEDCRAASCPITAPSAPSSATWPGA